MAEAKVVDQAAANKAAFDAEQESKRKAYDIEAAGKAAKAARQEEDAAKAAAKAEAVAAARKECDDAALAEGRITQEEINYRDNMVRQDGFDALMPWQVLPDDARVRCAFDRSVMLILPDVGHSKVFFSKGYDDVPESLVGHNGLVGSIQKPDKAPAPAPAPAKKP